MEKSKEQILEEIEELKKRLEELNDSFIDFELPKGYEKMSEEEKKDYQKKQDKLKKEALENMDNYSVVLNSHTIVTHPKNKANIVAFVREVGKLSSIPLSRDTFTRTVPEKTKEAHKKNLDEIDKLIERYNSTKAIRNDRIEFGVNFENFASNYFTSFAVKNLDRQSNKVFLEKYERQLDKNDNVIGDKFKIQNLTEAQKKDLIKIRMKLFAEKLDRLQTIATKKVKNDGKTRQSTYLEKHGIMDTQSPYRNGAKKFTTVKSVVSKRGVDMAGFKKNKTKLVSQKTTEEKGREEQSKARLVELNIMREKFDKFIKSFKGNGRQFSVEFDKEFPELAEKLYNQKAGGILSFRSQNLTSSPISVQEHEIEKQFEEEFRKANYRLYYKSYYIPASYSHFMNYLGKNFTNAKTKTERNLDQMKVREYEKEIRMINMRGDSANFETIIGAINARIQEEFDNYTKDEFKSFNKLSERTKKEELTKFLQGRVEELKSTVHKDKFFSLGTEKLERLGGVLISRDEKLMSKDVKTIAEILGVEQAEKYKYLTKNVKDLTTKFNFENSEIEKLGARLEKLSQMDYSFENSTSMQNIISEIDAKNKKIAILKSSLDEAIRKKSAFENDFASKQIDKAMTKETIKVASHNTSKSVFDKYVFPAVDAFGDKYLIERNSIEGKQVEKIVANFIMNFKNQVQNMLLTFSHIENITVADYVNKLQQKLEDDFGAVIRDLKKTQKLFKAQLETDEVKANEALKTEMENYVQRLAKIESDIIKKLKAMNIEIGDVTLAKNIK